MEKFEDRDPIVLKVDNQKVFGVLHLPLGETKGPAVMFCHGLAGQKTGQHRMYVQLAECLSRKGIASLRLDFRGSGDSEGAFSEMTLSGEIKDALAGLDFLVNHPRVDAARIGIFGRSFGGAIAMWTAEKFQKIKAIALWASIVDLSQWEQAWELVSTKQVDEKLRHELMRINGQLPGIQFYQELFQANVGTGLESLNNVPMLHIHGEKDEVVVITHAHKFEELRKNVKALTKFIRLPHSDHDFSHPEEKVQALQATCEWFKEQL